MFSRSPANPLISPADLSSARDGFEVIGTFNAGVAVQSDEVLMLLRVAERPIHDDDAWIHCPYVNAAGELALKHIRRDDPAYHTHDPRMVRDATTGQMWLTSISHLRLGRSRDGVHFTFDDNCWLAHDPEYASYGVEDARITWHEDDQTYYVNYSAVSPHGIATGLVRTADFHHLEPLGLMFLPSNRDVVIFPRKLKGQYVAYHRPMPAYSHQYNIWLATSPDMIHWGQHQVVLRVERDGWESGRIGGGAPPLWTEHGWLSIYHAADRHDRYCLGAYLTPHDQPERVIARSAAPILEPITPYELEGFFGNVVFTCGALIQNDLLRVYYGAADERMALAEAPLTVVLDSLLKTVAPNDGR
ncbi:glycoside hydrolase family 130 protein [Aggregatilineales bacterium SYSU G02658]